MGKGKNKKNKSKSSSDSVVATDSEEVFQTETENVEVVNEDVGVSDRTEMKSEQHSAGVSCDEMRKYTSDLSAGEGVDTSIKRVDFHDENVIDEVEDTVEEFVKSTLNSLFVQGDFESVSSRVTYSSLHDLLVQTRAVNASQGFFPAIQNFLMARV